MVYLHMWETIEVLISQYDVMGGAASFERVVGITNGYFK